MTSLEKQKLLIHFFQINRYAKKGLIQCFRKYVDKVMLLKKFDPNITKLNVPQKDDYKERHAMFNEIVKFKG